MRIAMTDDAEELKRCCEESAGSLGYLTTERDYQQSELDADPADRGSRVGVTVPVWVQRGIMPPLQLLGSRLSC